MLFLERKNELNMWTLTTGHQFDLSTDSGHFIPGQTADGQRTLQVAEHHLALQVIPFKVWVKRDVCGVGGEGHPKRRIVATPGPKQRQTRDQISLVFDTSSTSFLSELTV